MFPRSLLLKLWLLSLLLPPLLPVVCGVAMDVVKATAAPDPAAAGSGSNWDREHSNYPPDLEVDGRSRQFPNVSIFRILRHGCFDHDVTRFCGNRFTRFSCLYWIDTHAGDKTNSFKGGAKVEENLKKIGLDADFFENIDLTDGAGSIDVQQHSAASPHLIGGALVNTTNHPVSIRPSHGRADEEQKLPDCTVYRGQVDLPQSWRALLVFSLPAFLVVGGLGNLIAALALSRMGRDNLPICYFSSVLSGLDCAIVTIAAGDLWLRALAHVEVTYMLLFACETCCQVFPMLFSFAHHLRQLCLVAIAVDTLQLYRRLAVFYPRYNRERVFNCFVLFFALLLSLNCQFLWTYTLSRLDNPGETNRGYHCGFSDKWVEVRYRAIVWPLIDLMVGDVIPLLTSLYCAVVITRLYLWRHSDDIRCQWLRRGCVHKVVHDPDTFMQIRLVALLTFSPELLFSLPGSAFHFYKFVNSASHAVQEHIFSPQSLRSLLGSRSHAGLLDRKYKQDLFFNWDLVSHLLMLAWLSARPVVHFCCQSAFRRCLTEFLAQSLRRARLRGGRTELVVDGGTRVRQRPGSTLEMEAAADTGTPFLVRSF